MMLWMPSAVFPAQGEVKKDIVYGYNNEYLGLLGIDNPNHVTSIQNIEIKLVPDTPVVPPGPTNGDIKYGS